MVKKIALGLCLALGWMACNEVFAQEGGTNVDLSQRLFQNQYTQGGASMYNAGLYNAPIPVPRNVGATYYTYEALYPHEHLYSHKRTYYNYYATPDQFYGDGCARRPTGGGGLNKTTVVWQSGCNHFGYFPFNYTGGLDALKYNFKRKKYCLGASCTGKRLR